jgi:hypothetical protein
MEPIAGLIRVVSIILTAVVAISFGLFVWDELGAASRNQVALTAPDGRQVYGMRDPHGRLASDQPSKIRVKLDELNDTLTSPGESIGRKVGGGAEWPMRSLAFIFGMFVFLVGLRLLAGWVEGQRPTTTQAPPPQQGGPPGYTPGYR